MSTKRRKAIVISLTVAVVAAAGGIAYAYWTSNGSGSGSAGTGSTQPVTVVQESTVSELRPGGEPQALRGTFTNPNPGPVYVTSVTVSITRVDKAAGAPAGTCSASDYTLTGAVMSVGAEVASGSGQGSWSGATLAFNNKSDVNQDACKGATVTLGYVAA